MDYVGIDLHKRESQICVLSGATGEFVEKRVATDRAKFSEWLPKLAPAGCKVLLEASTESAWAAPAIEALGYEVIVADPNYAPMYGKSSTRRKRIKTDRRDARALAEACRSGTYRLAHRSSDKARNRRNLLTAREQIVGMRTGCIVTVRSLLRQHGFAVAKGAAEGFATRVRKLSLPHELATAVNALLVSFDVLSAQVDAMDAQLKAIVDADPELRRLTTAFGVGPVVAVAFHAAIDGPSRFKNAHKVEAYLGLVPGENSSGDGQHRTSITKMGSSSVRWLLVQSALTIMRSGRSRVPGLYAWAHGIASRRGSKVARVALARRMAGILFAMLRDQRNFEPQRFAPVAPAA